MSMNYEYVSQQAALPVKDLRSAYHTVSGLNAVYVARYPDAATGGPRADIVIVTPSQNLRFAPGVSATAPVGRQLSTLTEMYNLHASVQTVTLKGVTASANVYAQVSWVIVR